MKLQGNLSFAAAIFIILFSIYANALGNNTNRVALLHLKESITNDPFGVLSSWNDSVRKDQQKQFLVLLNAQPMANIGGQLVPLFFIPYYFHLFKQMGK